MLPFGAGLSQREYIGAYNEGTRSWEMALWQNLKNVYLMGWGSRSAWGSGLSWAGC